MKAVSLIALILVIVGAINWGLVGLFNFDLVNQILGAGTAAQVVYVLVGLSGVWHAIQHTQMCNMTNKKR